MTRTSVRPFERAVRMWSSRIVSISEPRMTRAIETAGPSAMTRLGRIRCRIASQATWRFPRRSASMKRKPVIFRTGSRFVLSPDAGSQCRWL